MSVYSDSVLADNPYAYYRCGDASSPLVDLGSGGFNLAGTATFAQPSLIPSDPGNKSIQGDGSSNVLSNASVPDYVGDLTVEAWIQSQASAVERWASRNQTTPTTGGWSAGIQGQTSYRFTTTGVFDYNFSTGPGSATTHYVVYVYDNTSFNVDLYVDGSFRQTLGNASGMKVAANSLMAVGAGNANSGGQEFWAGLIDEVAVYHAKLSPTRIGAHYAAGLIPGDPTLGLIQTITRGGFS